MGLLEKRIAAFSIDTSIAFIFMFIILGSTNMLLGGAMDGTSLLLMQQLLCGIFLILIYFLPYFKFNGQTIGKRFQRLRVINKDGSRSTVLKLIFRDMFKLFFSFFTFGLYLIFSYVFGLIRKDGLTPHDLLFQTKIKDLTIREKIPSKVYDSFVTLKDSNESKEKEIDNKEEEK